MILDYKLGRYEEVLRVYDEMIRINKNHMSSYLNKGIVL
ncbi:TPA: hypothetical protein DCZ39_05350 [Patescibacteria group bacterium]|nr:hypothetical protein [Candidatus Gracilibacteria bacterium]